jgi:hypothetical protein
VSMFEIWTENTKVMSGVYKSQGDSGQVDRKN